MKIYTQLTMRWDGGKYITEFVEAFDYIGPVQLCCGATAAQNATQQQQSAFQTTMTNQAQQVFGQDSTVFKDLVSSFAPTVAAGPNQEGFSAAEKSNLNSQAITTTGNAYKNAKQAVGEALAAQGGGNNPNVGAGSKTAIDLSVANGAAQQTASELGQINEADYQTGRQNYDTAASGLLSATNAFNSATSQDNATTNAGEAAANTENQIAQQNNSWVQGVTGALGAIGGAVATGGMSNLGKGVGFFGQNAP